jgi:tRNA(Ile2) C34 agmatinyltransferase TiaS
MYGGVLTVIQKCVTCDNLACKECNGSLESIKIIDFECSVCEDGVVEQDGSDMLVSNLERSTFYIIFAKCRVMS